jgi:hypothetical protein
MASIASELAPPDGKDFLHCGPQRVGVTRNSQVVVGIAIAIENPGGTS